MLEEIKYIKAYIWSAIDPKTNKVFKSDKTPTLEQQHWKSFSYNEKDLWRYTIEIQNVEEWGRLGGWKTENPNNFKYRVVWTNGDDDILHKFYATEEEAKTEMKEIENASCFHEMENFLTFFNFIKF